jgi:succinate dehydrogenase/fumarate reductase flavoprotein subunit
MKMTTEETVDVVVVGYGAAGMAAAITAHDAGASVLMLEKTPAERAGGNTRVSGQVWFSPVDIQAAKRHFRALAGQYLVPEDLITSWAEETAKNSDWILARVKEAGNRVPRDEGDPFEGDRAQFFRLTRGEMAGSRHAVALPDHEFGELDGNECGTEYVTIGGTIGFSRVWLLLKTCIDDRDIPVRFATPAARLVRGAGDEVSGVMTRQEDGTEVVIRARGGVVLGCGGFAANREMGRNYLRLPHATPWGSPANSGDGIRMAQDVGADLAHPYNYMAVAGIEVPRTGLGLDARPRGNRFISVGADGRRFINETLDSLHGKAWLRGTLDFHPGTQMWTIFDEDGRLAGPLVTPRASYAIGWLTQVEHYRWSLDNSTEIERGWIRRADTIPDLATGLGIDPDGLRAEVERYNAWVAARVDDPQFGRPAATMHPIDRPPFYGYEWAQLLITTLGGVRKDGRARAINPFGDPIPGLYCAGDVASSYTWCLSGGMALGDALAFGRVAGQEAASRASEDRS